MHPDSKFFKMIAEAGEDFRRSMERILIKNNTEMWVKMNKNTYTFDDYYYDMMMENVEINNAYDLGYAHDGYGY